MGKQIRISLSEKEIEITSQIATYYKRDQSDVIAEAVRRGLSDVVKAYLVVSAIEDSACEYNSLSQAIIRNWDKLTESRIPLDRLAIIRDGGDRPTELEVARLALALKVNEAEIEVLIPQQEKGRSDAAIR